MSLRFLICSVTCGILFVFLVLTRAEVTGPQVYGMAFQNITSDRAEEGYIQILCAAINKTSIIVLGNNKSFVDAETISMAGLGNSDSFNYTPSFASKLRQPDPVSLQGSQITNFGIIVSSNEPVHLVGVKTDKGTTDAYYLFPQTNNSVEFIIVALPRVEGAPFLSMIMVIPTVDGTCVELFVIFGGTTWVSIANDIVGRFQVFRYFASYARYIDTNGNLKQNLTQGEDLTGYFLNSSRPVQVIYGSECAWVPGSDNLFCDYTADAIPPRNQVGDTYIVPPIIGRSATAGYVVRVVPTQDNTEITYLDGKKVTKRLGEFLQFEQPNTWGYSVVLCDKPCLVAQYNKGYLSYNDVPTDPFMTVIVPVDRFTAGAPFGTASFCLDKGTLVDFNNFISIVTFTAYQDNILFDDSPIKDQFDQPNSIPWETTTVRGVSYSIAAFWVEPGFHYVSMSAGQEGSFAVYVYGHSQNKDSSSGYGYLANYNSTGVSVMNSYYEDKKLADDSGAAPDRNTTCASEAALLGSIISSNVGQYAPFPFRLVAGIDPGVDLDPACLSAYNDQLMQLLQDFSKKINYWICVSQNCSFLSGEGVAINYATLNVTYNKINGLYVSAEIYVEMIARMDVTAQNFAQCRAEIENYMLYFINWPPAYDPKLLHQVVGPDCPYPIPFQQPKFVASPPQCPVYNTI